VSEATRRETRIHPPRSKKQSAVVAALLATIASGCARYLEGPPIAFSPGQLAASLATVKIDPASIVLVGAGDIGRCDAPSGAAATARLIDGVLARLPQALVFTTGDHAYQRGAVEEFERCYDPSWGRFNARTYPSPGNHDYRTDDGAPYFDYFDYYDGDPQARERGYYSFDAGAWHVVSLNSNIAMRTGSPQHAWLTADLEATRESCVLAFWHQPLFSSGPRGHQPWRRLRDVDAVWAVLEQFNAELAINGHEHLYERFAPQNRLGEPEAAGLRQIVVGTGGGRLQRALSRRANSEVLYNDNYGVLLLMLNRESYEWVYLDADGAIRDRSVEPVPCLA
jgi:hypothetical protein